MVGGMLLDYAWLIDRVIMVADVKPGEDEWMDKLEVWGCTWHRREPVTRCGVHILHCFEMGIIWIWQHLAI